MVKQFIKKNSKGKEVPRGLPILESELNKDIPLKAVGKAIMPSEAEIDANPRHAVRCYVWQRSVKAF